MFFWSLVLFFFPYKSLCSRSKIIRSPSNPYSSSCSFISSRSDHNFIPVYWPKFTGKAKTKRNHSNLKNQSRFTKSDGRTVVRASPWFFGMEWFEVFPVEPYGPIRVSKPCPLMLIGYCSSHPEFLFYFLFFPTFHLCTLCYFSLLPIPSFPSSCLRDRQFNLLNCVCGSLNFFTRPRCGIFFLNNNKY